MKVRIKIEQNDNLPMNRLVKICYMHNLSQGKAGRFKLLKSRYSHYSHC